MSLPEQAFPFMAAAVAAYGPLVLAPADQAGVDTAEALGRELLWLAFGRQEPGAEIPPPLAAFAAHPDDEDAQFELEIFVDDALGNQPAARTAAAGALAGFYRGQAAAGDLQALVSLGAVLNWQDDHDGARAAYQQAIDAGHEHALLDLAAHLRRSAQDMDAAIACLRRAAGSADPGVAAEGQLDLADVLWSQGDHDGARAAYQALIEGGDAEWAPQAMLRLGHKLKMRRHDLPGARTAFQQVIDSGDPYLAGHAWYSLGDVLHSEGDDDGARAAWQQLIDARDPELADAALVSLLNLLRDQDDLDGVRALGRTAEETGIPEAPYAIVKAGEILAGRGDAEGARVAYQQAIDAGWEHADDLRNLIAELDGTAAQDEPDDADLAGLPPQFHPGNVARTGLEVLEHGLPALPEELSYQMAIPVAWWTVGQCAVVSFLQFEGHGRGRPAGMLVQASYARTGENWTPNRYWGATSANGDPIANPGARPDLDGQPITGGGSQHYREPPPPGYPAAIVSGQAAPDVTQIALIQDGREDRHPLESHFGTWVVCTERPGPFQVTALDAAGTTLATLHYSFDS